MATLYNKDGSSYDTETKTKYNPNVITSESLNTNIQPYNLPDYKPSTTADGFQESLTSGSKALVTEADRMRAERVKSQTESRSRLDTILGGIMQGNKAIADAPNTIDRTEENNSKKQFDEYSSQLEAEALSNRRRIETLKEKNPNGLFAGGLEQEVNRINSQSLSKQADLAILQNASLRKYDTARSIADKALEMKLEPLKANLENLKFFYTENKSMFDKEDDRLYSEAIKKEERDINKQEETGKFLSDLKLTAVQNGLSDVSTLNKLSELDITDPKARDKALMLVGKYASDPLDRAIKNAQLAKIQRETSLLGMPSEKELKESAAALTEAKASIPAMQDKIDAVDLLAEHAGLNTRVGPNIQARKPASFWGGVGKAATIVGIPGLIVGGIEEASGSGQDFAGGVHKLVNGMTLENLISAKARGATFGALSDAELQLLASSASKINDWEIKNDKGIGKGVWNIDEGSFKNELKNIQDLTRRALYLQNGKLFDSSEQKVMDEMWGANNTALDPSAYYYK